MGRLQLGVFFGGRSTEHEVSIVSASSVAASINSERFDTHLVAITKEGEWYLIPSMQDLPRTLTRSTLPKAAEPVTMAYHNGQSQLISLQSGDRRPLDVAFPVLHGPLGEDGTIQGLFRMMNLAFVGCDVLGSALSMDKDLMKRVLIQANIPTAKYKLLRSGMSYSYKEISDQLGLPLFVKPANAGSSIGVHKVRNENEFEAALKDAFLYDSKVLVEEAIQGREIELAVLGHRDSAKASLPGEVLPNSDFYSYEAKYIDPNGAALKIPADLTPEELRQVQDIGLRCYQLVDCEGLARVDFFLSEKHGLLVNEINTLPGFTSISLFPKLWTLKDYTYSGLVEKLIDLALEEQEKRLQLLKNFENCQA